VTKNGRSTTQQIDKGNEFHPLIILGIKEKHAHWWEVNAVDDLAIGILV
jgi:hypothetical protein